MNNKRRRKEAVKSFELLLDSNFYDPLSDTVRCGCGRDVKPEEVKFCLPIRTNNFYTWLLELDFDKQGFQFHQKRGFWKKFWYVLGQIPVVSHIIAILHDKFTRGEYIFDIECKYCQEEVYDESQLEE